MLKKLYCVILITASSSISYCAEPQEPVEAAASKNNASDLTERAYRQLEALDGLLEQIGLAVSNGVTAVADKKTITAHILELRKALGKHYPAHQEAQLRKQPEVVDLKNLLFIEKTLIGYVDQALKNGFEQHASFDEGMLHSKMRLDTELDVHDTLLVLQECELKMEHMRKQIKHIGYTPLNTFFKNVSSLDKKYKTSRLFVRSLPYVGLSMYWMYTHPHQVPQWGPFRRVRNWLIGTPTDPREEKPKEQAPAGLMGTLDTYCGNIVKFTREKEGLFNFTAAALIAPIIKKDAIDLAQWASGNIKKGFCHLKGIPYEDGSPFKGTKTVFGDIIGAEHAKKTLNHIVDYFKAKARHNQTGASIGRSYLLVGPKDTSRLLGQAVAGEVTAFYKAQKKTTECLVYQIHSSELITKKLKDILKEAQEKSPCIVIIDDLDWLYTQNRIDVTTQSEIAKSLDGMLTSKKKIFLVATISSAALLSPQNKALFCETIAVPLPTAEERAEFFERECTKRALIAARFDREAFVKGTEGYTFCRIRTVLTRALSSAQTKKEPLNDRHLKESLEEQSHHES